MTAELVYLASQSPRRRQLLAAILPDFRVIAVDIPEHWDGTESPGDYVLRLALAKARQGAGKLEPGVAVLGADTEVVLDNRILGKPRDRDHALRMLHSLSGRAHEIYTAVALVRGDLAATRICRSTLVFRPLGPHESEAYCESGEPFGKAGGYAIQGLAAGFVTRLQGSYSGIMGLPLRETRELLAEMTPEP